MSSPDTNNNITGARPRVQQNYHNFKQKKNFAHQLPFYDRYRRGLIFTGGLLTFLIVYSGPIYYFLQDPPENPDPKKTMWPGELAKGKTYAQQFRERKLREMAEEEAKKTVTV